MNESARIRLSDSARVALGIVAICLIICLVIYFLPGALEFYNARTNAERYLNAVVRSDTAAAKQVCPETPLDQLAKQIAELGGAEIQNLTFGSVEGSASTLGTSRSLMMAFSYRRAGEKDWKQGQLQMNWVWPLKDEGFAWEFMPAPERCGWPAFSVK